MSDPSAAHRPLAPVPYPRPEGAREPEVAPRAEPEPGPAPTPGRVTELGPVVDTRRLMGRASGFAQNLVGAAVSFVLMLLAAWISQLADSGPLSAVLFLLRPVAFVCFVATFYFVVQAFKTLVHGGQTFTLHDGGITWLRGTDARAFGWDALARIEVAHASGSRTFGAPTGYHVHTRDGVRFTVPCLVHGGERDPFADGLVDAAARHGVPLDDEVRQPADEAEPGDARAQSRTSQAARAKGIMRIVMGCVWFAAGVGFSAYTYARSGSTIWMLWWGAPLYGLWEIAAGVRLITKNATPTQHRPHR